MWPTRCVFFPLAFALWLFSPLPLVAETTMTPLPLAVYYSQHSDEMVFWKPRSDPRIVFAAYYDKPCDEGYGLIVIQLQKPMEWDTVEVDCGRIVKP